MQIADNDITAGQAFTIRVRKTDTNDFEASTPNAPELGSVVHAQRGQAIRGLNDRINDYIVGGYRPPKGAQR